MWAAAVLLAAVSATSAAPRAEIRNVRFSSPKILVSREKSDSDVLVGGQIRVDMFFVGKTARKPVLLLACLCETDAGLSVRRTFLDRPGTYDGLERSEILAALKRAGIDVSYKERENLLNDPAKFTPYLQEVSKEAYSSAVYGLADVKHGFFRLGSARSLPKVLLYRLELWQNGVLVKSYDSSRTGLASYEIPEDWHLPKKYPQKFKYADIR